MRGAFGALVLALWSGLAWGQLADGDYRTIVPPGWDGHTPLKLLIFIHGWQSSATEALADGDVTGPTARAGYLLVAPDGLGKSWSLHGAPAGKRRDETARGHQTGSAGQRLDGSAKGADKRGNKER